MPKRIPKVSLHGIVRDGVRIPPPRLDVPFDFTAEEIKEFTDLDPSSLAKIPKDEDEDDRPTAAERRAATETAAVNKEAADKAAAEAGKGKSKDDL